MSDDETPPAPETAEQQNRELLEKIFASVEKTRKMFLWTIILSVITFLLPLLGLAIAIPYFLDTYVSALSTQLVL